MAEVAAPGVHGVKARKLDIELIPSNKTCQEVRRPLELGPRARGLVACPLCQSGRRDQTFA